VSGADARVWTGRPRTVRSAIGQVGVAVGRWRVEDLILVEEGSDPSGSERRGTAGEAEVVKDLGDHGGV
jgi:hypothetical protein